MEGGLLYYKGNIRVNVAGHWKDGFKEPLYVVTNLEPREGMEIYKERMKIDQSFRDLKNLLAIDKNMSKTKDRMEKLMGIGLLAYAIGLWVGEELREECLSQREKSGTVSSTV